MKKKSTFIVKSVLEIVCINYNDLQLLEGTQKSWNELRSSEKNSGLHAFEFHLTLVSFDLNMSSYFESFVTLDFL